MADDGWEGPADTVRDGGNPNVRWSSTHTQELLQIPTVRLLVGGIWCLKQMVLEANIVCNVNALVMVNSGGNNTIQARE